MLAKKDGISLALLTSPVITAPTKHIIRDDGEVVSPVPPGWSGAPEDVAYALAAAEARLGNHVTFYATGDTPPHGFTVKFVNRESSYEDPNIGVIGNWEHEQRLIEQCYADAAKGGFDIIHSRFFTETGLTRVEECPVPTLVTLHSTVTQTPEQVGVLQQAQWYVFISYGQKRQAEALGLKLKTPQGMPVIYHGIDLHEFRFYPRGGEGLVMVARMHEEKGPKIAVEAANLTSTQLKLVGSNWGDPRMPWGEDPYWKEVSARIGQINREHQMRTGKTLISQVEFRPKDQTIPYYQHAKIALYPTQVEEPFGLGVVEAMACGTPVVAFYRGSMSELILEGVTGFLVDPAEGIRGFSQAIQRIYAFSEKDYMGLRRSCREQAEKFTVRRMAQQYAEAYQRVIREHGLASSLHGKAQM